LDELGGRAPGDGRQGEDTVTEPDGVDDVENDSFVQHRRKLAEYGLDSIERQRQGDDSGRFGRGGVGRAADGWRRNTLELRVQQACRLLCTLGPAGADDDVIPGQGESQCQPGPLGAGATENGNALPLLRFGTPSRQA